MDEYENEYLSDFNNTYQIQNMENIVKNDKKTHKKRCF